MAECTHDCSSCGENCSSREPQSLLLPINEKSECKRIIGVVSGKGGVGKSMVTSLLATLASRSGLSTSIMDADITGPSIPKIFGVHDGATSDEKFLYPVKTSTGIQIMSINLLLEHETDPVVWRGPVIAGVIRQFWQDVVWGKTDIMFIDMPPGTGDVPLTVFQSIPLDGIIIVTSPQELVSMIVGKAVKMAKLMNVPVLGLIENYSYFQCPNCGEKHEIFGKSTVKEVAEMFGIENYARLPMDPSLPAHADEGKIEKFDALWLNDLKAFL